MANLIIDFGVKFKREFKNFPPKDQEAIAKFIEHILEKGFEGLEGRNKRSDNVPYDDLQWRAKVTYAQQHSLWHYHIGIIKYDMNKPFGDRTSEYILHYQLLDNGEEVRIIDYSLHPPFKLPNQSYLEMEQ